MPKKKSPKPALDPSFSAKKPISAWNRPLQLDAKGIFGTLAKGALQGQRMGAENVLPLKCLSFLRLSQQILYVADLFEAQLEANDLSEAQLERADLGFANLKRANLSRANLRMADLGRANLEQADLQEAILEDTNLEGANLVNQDQLKGTRGTFVGKPQFFKSGHSRASKPPSS